MNGLQKVIKYCAMAFAVFLSVVILGTIISVVVGVTTGIAGVNFLLDDDKERINLSEEYSLEEARELGITSILVDCSAEIVVQPGEELSIEAVDVTEDYEIRQNNGRFSIVQDRPEIKIGFWFDDISEQEKVVVTIPAELSMEKIEIKSGSGEVTVKDLMTENRIMLENLSIDSGSGRVILENVDADRLYVDSGSGMVTLAGARLSETEINSGSGGVAIDASALGKLLLNTGSGGVHMDNVEARDAEVDTGSGRVSYVGVLTGTCEFETGSGTLTLRLDGKEEDYKVKAECGSGTFRINGKKVDDGSYGMNVKGEILIDSGSGSVNVEFNTPEEE